MIFFPFWWCLLIVASLLPRVFAWSSPWWPSSSPHPHPATHPISVWIHVIDPLPDSSPPSNRSSLDSHPHFLIAHFHINTSDWGSSFRQSWSWSTPRSMLDGGQRWIHVCIQEMNREHPSLCKKQEKNGESGRAGLYLIPWNRIDKVQNETINFYHPNLTLNLVADPSDCADCVKGLPPLFVNDFWNLARDLIVFNSSVREVRLHLSVEWISPFWHQIYDYRKNSQWTTFLGFEEKSPLETNLDIVKEMLTDINSIVILMAMTTSGLYLIYDIYLITLDILLGWTDERRKRLGRRGVSQSQRFLSSANQPRPSIRHTAFAAIQSLIVCLYVMEHSTNWLGKMSVFFPFLLRLLGLSQDFFLIGIVLSNDSGGWFGFRPTISLRKREFEQEEEKAAKSTLPSTKTQIYWWAIRVAGSLLLCQLLWYLRFGEEVVFEGITSYRSSYRLLLHELYSAILTFDLIMQTPQLFDNYRLKTVAYSSRFTLIRTLIFTFFDDVFSWATEMPSLYLLMCLRNDFLMMIGLYQMFIYPVDPNRMSPYGECLQEINDENKERMIRRIEYGENIDEYEWNIPK